MKSDTYPPVLELQIMSTNNERLSKLHQSNYILYLQVFIFKITVCNRKACKLFIFLKESHKKRVSEFKIQQATND